MVIKFFKYKLYNDYLKNKKKNYFPENMKIELEIFIISKIKSKINDRR